jgi:hypothetical protein
MAIILTAATSCTRPISHVSPAQAAPSTTAATHGSPTTPVATLYPTTAPAAPPDDSAGPTTAVTSASGALAVADGFAHHWIRGDLPEPDWWSGVAAYCDAYLASRLRTTDPARVPARTVIDPPFAQTVTAVSATFQFATNNGVLIVTCTLFNRRWLVTGVDFSLQDDE